MESIAAGASRRDIGVPRQESSPLRILGTEVHFGDDAVTGGALVWDGAVVHLAAFG